MCLWSQYCTSRFTVSLIISTCLIIKLKILSLFIYMIKNRSPEIVWCLTFASWQVMEVWLVQMGKNHICKSASHFWRGGCTLVPDIYRERFWWARHPLLVIYTHSEASSGKLLQQHDTHCSDWLTPYCMRKKERCANLIIHQTGSFKVHWLSEYRSKIYFANLF